MKGYEMDSVTQGENFYPKDLLSLIDKLTKMSLRYSRLADAEADLNDCSAATALYNEVADASAFASDYLEALKDALEKEWEVTHGS